MKTHTTFKFLMCLFLGSALSVTLNSALALQVSQAPLIAGAVTAPPNVMLMLDNSYSMGIPLFDPGNAIYSSESSSCSGGSIITAGGDSVITAVTVNMKNTGDPDIKLKFCSGAAPCGTQTTISSSKCFNPNQYYNIKNVDTGYSLGVYKGDVLNQYFNSKKTPSRMKIVKDSAKALITEFKPDDIGGKTKIRLGLTTFEGGYYNGAKTNDEGGQLLVAIDDLKNTGTSPGTTGSQEKKLVDSIGTYTQNTSTGKFTYSSGLEPDAFTPLAETLSDIGLYFYTGEIANPILHHGNKNGTADSSNSANTIFGAGSCASTVSGNTIGLMNSTNPTVTITSPIQYYCQKNAVILVTDGLPKKDRRISTVLQDYSKDCDASKSPRLCNATPTAWVSGTASYNQNAPIGCDSVDFTNDLMKQVTMSDASGNCKDALNKLECKNGTKAGRIYESIGSDYLDDVAKALFEMDLRPSFSGKPSTTKVNVETHVVGVAAEELQSDSVIKAAADYGGGIFAYAKDQSELISALKKAIDKIKEGENSFSVIVANSTQLSTDSAIFQAKFDTADWTGDLLAWGLNTTTGDVLDVNWNAGGNIPNSDLQSGKSTDWKNRNIFTYNDQTATGVAFTTKAGSTICAQLSDSQRTALSIPNTTACNDTTNQNVWLLDWVRGDISHEQINSSFKNTYHATSTPQDPRAASAYYGTSIKVFRNRARFYTVAETGHSINDLKKDPWLLGDIVNSDGAYVSNENYGYDTKSGLSKAETDSYFSFLSTKNLWRKMVYIGANDGMLHGFDAKIDLTSSYADEGKEIIAYLPKTVFAKLADLASPNYTHKYYVDGSPKVGDVYLGTKNNNPQPTDWHTILVGTTGAGGTGVFALDVTNPNSFSTSDVLWEINDQTTAQYTKNNSTDVGFTNYLGYTLPSPSINRMNDGSWAVIVANGYQSANNQAVLYILDIATGKIIRSINTNQGSSSNPNGLSTPFVADLDNNGTADAIYAGDLLGNMWKFDVSSSNSSNWSVSYGGNPMFIACDLTPPIATSTSTASYCPNNRQPITQEPQVGKVGSSQTGGVMVYFGTGKYFEDSDNTNTQKQTYYGVWDQCAVNSSTTCTSINKNQLKEQSITYQGVVSGKETRVTSKNTITYPTDKGWYMDLVNVTVSGGTTTKTTVGERVISSALLRGSRLIFVTLIPNDPNLAGDCTTNSSSTGWLMEIDTTTGGRLSIPPFDTNGDNVINDLDLVSESPSSSNKVPASGTKNNPTDTPAVIEQGSMENKYTAQGAKKPDKTPESKDNNTTPTPLRQSWRQL